MSLAQFYNLPNKPKRSSTNPALPDAERSTLPDIQELAREMPTRWGGLLSRQDDWLAKFIDQPHRSNHTRQENTMPAGWRFPNNNSELFSIYNYETRQAVLTIQSFDRQLSDENILDLLTDSEDVYWGRVRCFDSGHQGYVGLHVPESELQSANPQPRTYITIAWPVNTKMHLINRLRVLAREGCKQLSFWPALVGAIAAVDQALHNAPLDEIKMSNLPAAFAYLNFNTPIPGRNRNQEAGMDAIGLLAHYMANPLSQKKCPNLLENLDDCGRAFLWMALGKALWLPESLRYAGLTYNQVEEYRKTFGFFVGIADQWINLVSFDQIEIALSGARLRYDCDTIIIGLWQQAIELERWKISPEALKYLHRRQPTFPEGPAYGIADWFDEEYGDALAQKLISEAQQRRAFVPCGGFRTALPVSTPITGVEELRIWTDGTGLWVLPLPAGFIFHWRPELENPLSRHLSGEDYLSAWNLLLAALWHDLVTEGQKVIVRTGNDLPTPNVGNINGKKRRRRGRSYSDTHVLRLPSKRVIQMNGIHVWGTPEEIEKIKRQAHQVRGHRRKLSPGQQRSLYALANARNFSFILPDGYTFVKPYQTGLANPDAPAAKETPILARGLASLMLMSKEYSKRSAA